MLVRHCVCTPSCRYPEVFWSLFSNRQKFYHNCFRSPCRASSENTIARAWDTWRKFFDVISKWKRRLPGPTKGSNKNVKMNEKSKFHNCWCTRSRKTAIAALDNRQTSADCLCTQSGRMKHTLSNTDKNFIALSVFGHKYTWNGRQTALLWISARRSSAAPFLPKSWTIVLQVITRKRSASVIEFVIFRPVPPWSDHYQRMTAIRVQICSILAFRVISLL